MTGDDALARGRRAYFGDAGETSPYVSLRAGPWRLIYTDGQLRCISYRGREAVRRIYVTARDRYWNNVPAQVSDVRLVERGASFEITFSARNAGDEIDLVWQGVITGGADGLITYRMRGEARRSYWRNRIGICVLHPHDECAGKRCRVTHADGAVEEGFFPDLIAPHQPFVDIRAIAYEVGPGAWFEMQFAGEVFEMEDQRNWTDGSFKTYCPPLAVPRPAWVEAGALVEQSVALRLAGSPAAEPGSVAGDDVRVSIGEGASHAAPALGLALSDDAANLDPAVTGLLRRLRLAHLRGDVFVGQPGWELVAQRLAAVARALDVPVEMALFLPQDWQGLWDRLAELLRMLPDVETWLVFAQGQLVTPPELAQAVAPRLRALTPRALLGGGSNGYFSHLNRARPPAGLFDLLSYPATPQVHAEDEDTMVESLAAQAATVRTARSFAHGARIAVSPITLKPRSNPAGLAAGLPATPPPSDSRQASRFAAAWTAISFKYLAESGAGAVTYYETTGARGVLSVGGAAPTTFPAYDVLAAIGEFARGVVIPCVSSEPLRLDALLLANGTRRRLVVANFAASPTTAVVSPLRIADGTKLEAHRFDETDARRRLDVDSRRAAERLATLLPDGGLLLRASPHELTLVDWDAAGAH